MSEESKLEAKLQEVSKDIRANRKSQPDVPLLLTKTKEPTTMATKTKKNTKTDAKPEKAAAAPIEGYTANDLAADLGTDSVTLRKALRDIGAEKPGGRWVWPNAKAAASLKADLKAHLAAPKKTATKAAEPEGKASKKASGKVDKTAAAKKASRKKARAAKQEEAGDETGE